MAQNSKSNTVETESSSRGQKIITSFGVDNASSIPLNDSESCDGREMKGGTDNLSHSLKGSSAVQEQTGKSK